MHIIHNEHLKITVNPKGAELCSIQSVKTGKGFMWEGNPEIWGSTAPVLFPIVGGLKDNTYYYKGQAYHLPRHGFIRNNANIILKNASAGSLTFSLKYNEETLKAYPFLFEFNITYTLIQNKIEVKYEIINHGPDEMLFSLGGHPAFKCPLNANENYTDYFIEFETKENLHTWELDKNGQIEKLGNKILDNSNVLKLDKNLFDNDALIFKNIQSRKVSLKSIKSDNIISVSFKGFPYLGIWAKPKADFVCIEPWLGIADHSDTDQDFGTKEGILRLEPKETFRADYFIEIKNTSP